MVIGNNPQEHQCVKRNLAVTYTCQSTLGTGASLERARLVLARQRLASEADETEAGSVQNLRTVGGR
jgi:hypothetical protein